jgi:phage replication-related protein YjqB (UPF0714/DUF867 family)
MEHLLKGAQLIAAPPFLVRPTYKNFEELLAREIEGRDFFIESVHRRSSGVIVIAPHGGRIEPATDQIARRIAGHDFSFYVFRATKPQDNWRLHVSSHQFDEYRALRLVERHRVVVTVHGCRGLDRAVYIGGLDVELGERIGASLNRAGIKAATRGHSYPGRDASNICNRGVTRRGVQLELTRGLRLSQAVNRLVDAVRCVLHELPCWRGSA